MLNYRQIGFQQISARVLLRLYQRKKNYAAKAQRPEGRLASNKGFWGFAVTSY